MEDVNRRNPLIRVHENSLYYHLNFFVNLKLLKKRERERDYF